MKNAEYWENRFTQLEQSQHSIMQGDLNIIEKQYAQTQQILDGQIALWYQRFADNNKITLAQAKQYVQGNALNELKWNIHEYIQHGKENGVTADWKKELENASAKFHITKLEALKIQTQQSLENLFTQQAGTLKGGISDIYQSGYYHTAFEIQKGYNIGFDISSVDQAQLEKIISKPWAADKYNFSERIWGYKNQLITNIHNILSENIRMGSDPQKAIDQISKAMNNSKYNAGRLVMTEGAYFSSLAQQDCFNKLDVQKYEIVATLDDRTSETCKSLDGKVFEMKYFRAGDTAPPFHPYCRSTTAPYFDTDFGKTAERAARNGDGKTYYIPDDIHYQEWKNIFVDGGDKSKFSVKEIEGTKHYFYNKPKAPEPEPPKPKKTYLTKKKLIANIADADVKLEELHEQFSDVMKHEGDLSWEEFITDYDHDYSQITNDANEAAKLKNIGDKIDALEQQKSEWQKKLDDKLIKEKKKELLIQQSELSKKTDDLQKQLDSLEVKTYSGIWKNDVTTVDYSNLNITGKLDYYKSKLSSGVLDDVKKKQFEDYIKQLEELEQEGKIYSEIQKQLNSAKSELNTINSDLKYIKENGKIRTESDVYNKERKDNALWFDKAHGGFKAADKYFDMKAKAVHGAATPNEHHGFYTYTSSSGGHNRPLAGFEKPWSKSGTGWEKEFYKGAKNVWIDFEGKGDDIRNLTSLIEKSTYDADVWLQSGQNYATLEGFLHIPYGTLSGLSDDELSQFIGRKERFYQFLSTAVNEGGGAGFNCNPMKFNIFVPKGSEMLYASDVGAFGKGENEMILQRGGSYQITNIYWGNDDTDCGKKKLFVDLELHLEDGYDKFQQNPSEWTGSKKNYHD